MLFSAFSLTKRTAPIISLRMYVRRFQCDLLLLVTRQSGHHFPSVYHWFLYFFIFFRFRNRSVVSYLNKYGMPFLFSCFFRFFPPFSFLFSFGFFHLFHFLPPSAPPLLSEIVPAPAVRASPWPVRTAWFCSTRLGTQRTTCRRWTARIASDKQKMWWCIAWSRQVCFVRV